MVPVFLGISALGINLPSLLAQLINFTLLLVLLTVLAYKPLLRVLDERKKRIQEGLEASEAAKQRQAARAAATRSSSCPRPTIVGLDTRTAMAPIVSVGHAAA